MMMKNNDIIKLVFATTLFVGVFFGSIFVCLYFVTSLSGVALGMIVGTIAVVLLIAFVYPILFKDYIERYWKEQEAKDNESEL